MEIQRAGLEEIQKLPRDKIEEIKDCIREAAWILGEPVSPEFVQELSHMLVRELYVS